MATTPVLTPAQFAAAFNLTPSTTTVVGAAATNAQYVTKIGDRWDLVAWYLYGDPTQITALISANPGQPLRCTFDPGTTILGGLLPPPTAPASSTPWQP